MSYFNFAESEFAEIEKATASPDSPGSAAGSSSALTAVLAVSLIRMACQVQAEKSAADIREKLMGVSEKLTERQQNLYDLAEMDHCAVTNTCEEVMVEEMTEVPLKLAGEINSVLETTGPISDLIAGELRGDFRAGIELLRASFRATLAVIKINFYGLNEEKRSDYVKRVKKIKAKFSRHHLI